MNRRARPRGRGWSGLLSAAWLSAAAAAAAPPWPEGEAELAFGYDSNPAQSADGPGLAFVRLAFDAARAWPRGEAELSVGADGWYTDQEGPNDNLRLALHTDWTRSTAGGLGRLTLGATGALYRDDLVPADARNEAAVSLRYARTLGPRDSASATAEVRWLDYIYPSLPWAGRPGSGPANPTVSANAADAAMHTGPEAQGTHSGNPQGGLAVRRTDRLSGLALDATHDWTPRAAVTLSGAFARCDSPTPVNAYARAGLGLLLRTDLAATWPLEVGVGWSRTRYDRAPRQLERVDTELTAGLSLRHSLGPAEAHCGLNWVHSDSTAPGRSFRQQVVRCGLAWSF